MYHNADSQFFFVTSQSDNKKLVSLKIGVMKKSKVLKTLSYQITLDWSNDFILSRLIEHRIAKLLNDCDRDKSCGLCYDFYLEEIKYLRGVLHQIYLHSDI